MEPILTTFEWNDFSGGEGDGFIYGPKGSYRLGENIDSRRIENGVFLCSPLTTPSTGGTTYAGTIYAVAPDYDRVIATGDGTTGRVYFQGTVSTTMVTGDYSHDVVKGFGKMLKAGDTAISNYGISASNVTSKIHRFTNTFTLSAASVASFNASISLNTKVSVLNLGGSMCFGANNIIYTLANTETVTETLVLPSTAIIIGITQYLDTYKVFYNDGLNGYIGYWAGPDSVDSGFLSQVVEYKNSLLVDVVNDGSEDYAIFGVGGVSDLYRIGGLQRVQIRNNVEGSTANTRLLDGNLCITEGITYIGGQNKLGNACLYSYGNYYPGYNSSLVPENVTSISRMQPYIGGIYIYTGGNILWKPFLINIAQTKTGVLTSFPIIGNKGIRTLKNLKTIYVSYDLGFSGNSIKIYVKVNGGVYSANSSGWNLLKTITTTTKHGVRIDSNEIKALNLGNYSSFEFKIEIIANNQYSPIFYGLEAFYEDELKDS